MAGSSGAMSPLDATQQTLQTGLHHLEEGLELTLLKNVYGGLLLSAGGLLSLTLSAGFPGLAKENPGIQRLAQGLAFPLGLIMVYLAGAELYTGYPMWFVMTALARHGRPMQYVRSIMVSWIGNLIGCLLFASCMSVFSETLTHEPWRSGIVSQVTEDIVELRWHVILLRAIGCGWLVTIAMFLGTQNQDGISKALALHLPFFVSTTARFPHTVEYMYLASTGMMLGAPLSVGGFLWKCMLPITLGNAIGGGFFTGAYLWWVNLHGADDQKQSVPDGWQYGRVGDEDDH